MQLRLLASLAIIGSVSLHGSTGDDDAPHAPPPPHHWSVLPNWTTHWLSHPKKGEVHWVKTPQWKRAQALKHRIEKQWNKSHVSPLHQLKKDTTKHDEVTTTPWVPM